MEGNDYEFYTHGLKDDSALFNHEIAGNMNMNRQPRGHPGMNMERKIYNRNQHKGLNPNINNVHNNAGTTVVTSNSFWVWNILNYSIFGFTVSEIFLGFMLISFCYFHFIGKTFNDKYASVWYEANSQYFESKFSRLGVKPEVEPIKNNTELIKDAYNIYKYYAEDYKGIILTITAILEFRNKQSTASLISGLVFKIVDKIYYRVSIQPIEPVPNVFCICKKSEKKEMLNGYKELVSQ